MLQQWESEGEFYIGGFVLCQLIERQPNRLNECQQYKTDYRICLPNAVAFTLVFNYSLMCPLTINEPVIFTLHIDP